MRSLARGFCSRGYRVATSISSEVCMSNRITKSLVEAAVPVPGRDIWLWDGEAKGFGLRVRSSGRKVYIIEYRALSH